MAVPRKLKVFLCHASQDKPVVRDLYQRLLAEEWIDPWLDEEKLLPGQDWNLEIVKAVESADAVLVCVSTISMAKEGYVQKELRRILDLALEKLEGAIFIIPVRLDDCGIPRQLKDWQFLDYFPESRHDTAYDRLRSSLQTRMDALGI
jgi:TIR domain-containing protein